MNTAIRVRNSLFTHIITVVVGCSKSGNGKTEKDKPEIPRTSAAGKTILSACHVSLYYCSHVASVSSVNSFRRFIRLVANNMRQRRNVFGSSCRPVYVNTCFVWRDICVLSGAILMKPATDIHHVSGNWWKGFQGQRSKDKLMCECYTSRQCFSDKSLVTCTSQVGMGLRSAI